MGLKAPGILTFMVSVILTVTVLIMKFFGAQIPFFVGHEFWVLLSRKLSSFLAASCAAFRTRRHARNRCALLSRGTQRSGCTGA